MDIDSTCNLIKGTSRLAVVLIFGATALAAHAAPVTTQGTWWGTDGTDGTLKARDINGNAVALNDANATFFYDTNLDITWLADWNVGAGPAFDDGRITWDSAVAWATNLVVGDYGGWRLPTALNADGTGPCVAFACNDSEMGHMYYLTLGNPVGGPLENTAYFTNMESYVYWSGTELLEDPNVAWHFLTASGFQYFADKGDASYAVAVRAGDVLATQAVPVPEPGTLALLLAGVGVGAVMRRRRAR